MKPRQNVPDMITNTTNGSSIRSRRQTTIQIRKQRKEELLRRKRGIPATTTNTAAAAHTDDVTPSQRFTSLLSSTTTTKNVPSPMDQTSFRTILTTYCSTPTTSSSWNDPPVVVMEDQRVHIIDSHDTSLLESLYAAIVVSTSNNSNNYIVTSTLRQCLLEDRVLYGYQLMYRLMMDLQQQLQRPEYYREMVATILVELTSIQFSESPDSVLPTTDTTTSKSSEMEHYMEHNTNNDNHYYYQDTTTNNSRRLPNWYELLDVTKADKSNTHNHRNYNFYLQIIFQMMNDPKTTSRLVELLCNLLGNFVVQPSVDVDDPFLIVDHLSSSSSSPQKSLPPNTLFMETLVTEQNWSILLSKLPWSTYCCACIIRMDQIHYAMDFLRPLLIRQEKHQEQIHMMTPTSDRTIPDTFIPLLLRQNERTCVEMAWILEGLTRREVEGIHVLLSISNAQYDTSTRSTTDTESTLLLFVKLIEQIHYHTHQLVTPIRKDSSTIPSGESIITSNSNTSNPANADLSKSFLVPALRTICNIAYGLEHQCHQLLQPLRISHLLIDTINVLLQHNIVIDAIYAAHSLLFVVIMTTKNMNTAFSDKVVTLEADQLSFMKLYVSNFVPHFVHIVTNSSSRLEWKRESIICISDVVLDFCSDLSIGQSILQEYVWHVVRQSDVRDHSTLLIQSLVDALQLSDMDVVSATMKLLNVLLRTIDDSRTIFIHTNGIDVLNDICSSTDLLYDENTQDLAVQLLEDYFEIEDDEDNVNEVCHDILPIDSAINTFTFGIPNIPTKSFAFDSVSVGKPPFSTSATESQQHQISNGRGRGRVVPAWMSQQQSP